LFAPRREKIQIQLTTYSHKLLIVIGVLKERLWWNWHNDKGSLPETIDSAEFTFQIIHFCKLCCYFSNVDSTTHNWTTIHVCDNVSFLKGGLHASCNKVSFKGKLLSTMFISKVRYMHLCKNVLSGGHLYIPRFLFKGGLCASLATMFFQEVNFSSEGNFQYKTSYKKGSAYVIQYVHPSIQHAWGALQHVHIYIKLPILRSCKFQYIYKLSIQRAPTKKENIGVQVVCPYHALPFLLISHALALCQYKK